MSWLVLVSIAGGAYLFKLVGALAAERVGAAAATVTGALMLLPPALLTALVLVWTFDGGDRLVVDARLAGVAGGSLAAWLRAPFVVVVVIAATLTATVRAATG